MSEDRLVKDLDDPHWQIRASAAEELGRRHAEHTAERLAQALTDESEEVRSAAVMSIGRLGLRWQIDKIRTLLGVEEDSQTEVLALYALSDLAAGETGPALRQDTEVVVRKLADKNRLVRRAARRVLVKLIGRDNAEPFLQARAEAAKEEDAEPEKPKWHYDRIEDRLSVAQDGECTLSRTFTVRGEGPGAIQELGVFLPEAFPDVDGVADAKGSSLEFEVERYELRKELWFDVPPIAMGESATFTFTAKSRRLLFLSGSNEVLFAYSPAPIDAAVTSLHIEIQPATAGLRPLEPKDLRLLPQGQAVTLDRAGLSRDDLESVVLRAGIPASALKLPHTPPRRYTRGGDLSLAAGVAAVILGILAAAIILLRRRLGEASHRAILAAALTAGALLLLCPILIEDNLPYYALSRSAVMDGDLDRRNEYSDFNQTLAFAPDHRDMLDPVFGSFYRTPFLVAAHGVTSAINKVSPGYAPNGFSFPYLYFAAIGDFLAVLIGCLACFSLVERRVGRPFALFAVLSVVAGTNLLLFAYGWIGSSFQPSFLLFSVFLNHWDRTRDRRSSSAWLLAGVLLGLLAITRTLNVGFLLIPFLGWVHIAAARIRSAGTRGLVRHAGDGALLTGGFLLGYAPQLLLQRLVDQTWFVDAYGVGSGRFTGLRDNFWGMFLARSSPFSWDGILTGMPMFCLAFLGLIPLIRFDRRLGTVVTATLALQLFAITSYEIYWGYFKFGSPYLVPSSAILCLGMGSLMKAVHSRWRTLGPPLLWALAVPLAARNVFCVLQQLSSDLMSGWEPEMGVVKCAHVLLMLDRKLDAGVLHQSSECACLVREIVGALRAGDLGQLFAALCWAAVLLAAALLAYTFWVRIGRWTALVPSRIRRPLAVTTLLVASVALFGWFFTLGASTDVDYRYFSKREKETKRELKIERIGPGETFTLKLSLRNPITSVTLITFLEDAAEVPKGTRVGTVEFDTDWTRKKFDLHAGVDTADFAIDQPELRGLRGHAAPLDKACFSWRVHDDSSYFYTARAYRSIFEVPTSNRTGEVSVTSTLTRGTLSVVLANVVEPKLPRDPNRRRWLADRR